MTKDTAIAMIRASGHPGSNCAINFSACGWEPTSILYDAAGLMVGLTKWDPHKRPGRVTLEIAVHEDGSLHYW